MALAIIADVSIGLNDRRSDMTNLILLLIFWTAPTVFLSVRAYRAGWRLKILLIILGQYALILVAAFIAVTFPKTDIVLQWSPGLTLWVQWLWLYKLGDNPGWREEEETK